MSNKTESKGARRRGLATRIMAWILSILMMGSMITLAVTIFWKESDRQTHRPPSPRIRWERRAVCQELLL